MGVSRAEFLAEVRSARDALRQELAGRDKRSLSEATIPGSEWTARDVLAHLIGYDRAILGAIEDVRAGRTPVWGWTTFKSFDPWNAMAVEPRRKIPFATVLAELQASGAALLKELETWPDDAGPFGPDTWDPKKSAIGWLGHHEREHTEAIATLG